MAALGSQLAWSAELYAFVRFARGRAQRTTRPQGSRVSPRGARSSHHGRWLVSSHAGVRVRRVRRCDALGRPVAHTSSSWVAYGCTLALHTGSVREQRVRWPSDGRAASTRVRARRVETCAGGTGGRKRNSRKYEIHKKRVSLVEQTAHFLGSLELVHAQRCLSGCAAEFLSCMYKQV